jgi:hypothetical protein
MRPLQNTPFCPISSSGSNFNPRNTTSITVVKIIAFLELEQKYLFCKGLFIKKKTNLLNRTKFYEQVL